MRDTPDEVEADFHEFYGLDIYNIDRDKASRLLYQLPNRSRTYVAKNPVMQWGWQEEFLRQILFKVDIVSWQLAKPGERKNMGKWKNAEPKIFEPEFLKKTKTPKDQVAMDIDQLKEFLAKPRKAVK